MANRPTIMGTRHVIAAGHYLAAHAGFKILEGGGNAAHHLPPFTLRPRIEGRS